MGKRMPPFARGDIVNDYEPLYRYWELARSLNKDELFNKAMITEEDFEFLSRLVKGAQTINLLELINALKVRFRERIDSELASRSLGMPQDTATELLSSILAGWLIEAAETFKIVGLRQRFKLPES